MTAPTKSAEKVPLPRALAYGAGTMAGSILGYGMGSLFAVFNLVLGVSPALVGLAQSLPRFVDIFTDPLVGYLSDSLRPRFSRGFFVALGSVFGGIFAALIWLFPLGLSTRGYFAWMLVFTSLAMIGWSLLSVPLQALGFEITRNANERTKLMAVANFMNSALALAYNWVYVTAQSPLFKDTIHGIRWVGCTLAGAVIVLGLTSARCCRGRSAGEEAALAPADRARVPTPADFLKAAKRVVKNRPFILLTFSIVTMLIGLFGAGMCGTYIDIYYVMGGSQAKGMVLSAVSLTAYQVASLVATAPVLWLAKRIGKKGALLIFLGLGFSGNALKWLCYSPARPWLVVLPMITCGLGFTALWVLTSSMMADISDADEADTGSRDAGMFAAFYIWTIKFATSLAIASGGLMLSLTGFDVALGTAQVHGTIMMMRVFDFLFPAACTLAAIALISRYPITEAKMIEVQAVLQRRRT